MVDDTSKPEGNPPDHESLERFLKDELKKAEGRGLSFFFGSKDTEAGADPGFTLEPGQVIGEYRLEKRIAQGGMGQVWEATQTSLGRKVALKVVRPDRISTKALHLFAREARAGGRLAHPAIVTIYDHGETEGIRWIAMELVEGGWTLTDFIIEMGKREQLPPDYYPNVAKFVALLARALQSTHEAGVIHRDLKPQNVLITPDDQPKLTDFGLAKITDETAMTQTGDFAGTYYYMSPEQVTAGRIRIDHRTDIFSLGVLFYEMLGLRRPFEGDTSHQIADQIVSHDPPRLEKIRSRVPRDLAVICGKAMEKARDQRYPSMAEFADDLERHLKDEPIRAKPPGTVQRAVKWSKRHPVVSVSGLVASLAMIVIVVLFVQAVAARKAAVREGRRADAKAEEALEQAGIAKKQTEKANEQARIAQEQTAVANEQKDLAETRYEEIIRLSDVKRLTNLQTEAEELWPASPERVEGLKTWLADARALTDRLADHRAQLEALRQEAQPYTAEAKRQDRETHPQWGELTELRSAKAKLTEAIRMLLSGKTLPEGMFEGPVDLVELKKRLAEFTPKETDLTEAVSKRRTYAFADTERQWRHDTLSDLVSDIASLQAEPSGLMKDIEKRLAFAESVQKKTIDDYRAAWDRAIASIADDSECPEYKGLVLEPIVGLIPLGRDPDSGLWEFAHLQTGEIPERDDSGHLVLTESMGVVFVLIPGGTFTMGAIRPSEDLPEGSPNVDPEAESDEGPLREVTLRPFFLSKYETTQGQWSRFTGDNPSSYRPDNGNPSWNRKGEPITLLHPVEQVSWEDCTLVLSRLDLRLPTESEWEYAARGGASTVWWSGNELSALQGAVNLCDKYCKDHGGHPSWSFEEGLDDGYTVHSPVGVFRANAFGLHDVMGNVFEWCQDVYGPYSSAPRDGSAQYWEGSERRVFRGGCWCHHARSCRSAYRSYWDPDYRSHDLGFRPPSPCLWTLEFLVHGSFFSCFRFWGFRLCSFLFFFVPTPKAQGRLSRRRSKPGKILKNKRTLMVKRSKGRGSTDQETLYWAAVRSRRPKRGGCGGRQPPAGETKSHRVHYVRSVLMCPFRKSSLVNVVRSIPFRDSSRKSSCTLSRCR